MPGGQTSDNQNASKVLTVPGIGAIVVGTNDLSIALGIGRATRADTELPPETMEGILTVAKAATARGVYWGISVPGTKETAQQMINLGSRYPLGSY